LRENLVLAILHPTGKAGKVQFAQPFETFPQVSGGIELTDFSR
jgi:hypothetical protein